MIYFRLSIIYFAVVLGICLEQLTLNLKTETLLIFPLSLSLFIAGLPEILFYKDRKRLKALEMVVKEMEKTV